MAEPVPSDARYAPAVGRNRDAILEVLRPHLIAAGVVLEIAAGSGEHAVHFASHLPHLRWLPADADPEAFASIVAWRAYARLPNLLAPVQLNAADPGSWPVGQVDAIVCINMVHISPWVATEGLMAGAGRYLSPAGLLFLYGPFHEAGVETTPSNMAFDASLRQRDPEWGLRHLDQISALALRQGLLLNARVKMPANNLSLVYRRADCSPASCCDA